jgi:hypothetical protein
MERSALMEICGVDKDKWNFRFVFAKDIIERIVSDLANGTRY